MKPNDLKVSMVSIGRVLEEFLLLEEFLMKSNVSKVTTRLEDSLLVTSQQAPFEEIGECKVHLV